MKRTNKGAQSRQRCDQPPAEIVERRPPAKGNRVQTAVPGTQGPESASIGLNRVREAAKRDKDQRFTNLLHHIDIEQLHVAYLSLNPKAAAGIDEVTWQEYGEGLDVRLITLCDQIHSGRYRARASKRIWIPKSDGRQRPILLRKTIGKRLRNKIKEVRQTLHRHRHNPVTEQGRWLRSVVQGHFNYYAVPGNREALDTFRTQIGHAWLHALRRRSQKGRNLTWERMQRQMMKWIPTARVLHPYPNQRFCV